MSSLFATFLEIKINNKAVTLEQYKAIESIDFSDSCEGSDTVTLSVNDPDFLFINDNIFVEDTKISIKYGFEKQAKRLTFEGNISTIDIDFPDTGSPKLSIYCLDTMSHRMNRKKRNKSWSNTTRPKVAEEISKNYGYKFVKQKDYKFVKEESIAQSDQTDIEFLENLASEETAKFMCKPKNGTVKYVKLGILDSPKCTVEYRQGDKEVISFSPQINKETIQESQSSSSVDSGTKKSSSSTADGSTTDSSTSQGTKAKSGDGSGKDNNSSTRGLKYNPKTGKWK